MEILFATVEISLVLAAILAMTAIVREVLPSLTPEDQDCLRGLLKPWMGRSYRVLRQRDRAIRTAWNQHVQSFPRSRKRTVFALCFVAAVLSPFLLPLLL